MAKFSIQFPFHVREAMTVGRSLALHAVNVLATPPDGHTYSEAILLSVKESCVDNESTTMTLRYEGGTVVRLKMISYDDSHNGTSWTISEVTIRYFARRGGYRPEKAEKKWTGTELQQLASVWGGKPYGAVA